MMVLPHSRRRRHLHHSYDPRMHFGRERHHHRWSRVTAADLIDEGKYRHSGSIHVIVLSPDAFVKPISPTPREGPSSLRVQSVRIHFDESGTSVDKDSGAIFYCRWTHVWDVDAHKGVIHSMRELGLC